ncbi:helix-turn-helix domain-containing protein [Hyalangium minutum]|uniref:Uncharacterized protein n=1 Tax=Hyalangium minutum TaxID=394096 RepID=A0A085WQE7_9BACT|nr:helix-turn-helix domain-containing protein [Hyalangium minutum]KFE69910.1 hypothetical protein DB31_4952 [Hyalangium minutum]
MKPFEQQTYYELLEIPVSAPDEEIRAAYTRALETYAPDSVAVYALVDPGQVDALRARLTEAMEILTEPDLRAEYDRMIGVSRADSSAVKALTPALAAAAQSVPSQETSQPPAAPAPEAAPAAQTPASAVVAAPSAPEPAPAAAASAASAPTPTASSAPASTPPQAEPVAAPAPAAPAVAAPTLAVPEAPLGMPGIVTPSQVHAAFRSYAISYVPVLVPAPALISTAVASPFVASGQAEAAPPAPEAPAAAPAAPAPEAVAARAVEPVPPAAAPASTASAAPQSATSTPAATSVASSEPAAVSTPAPAPVAASPAPAQVRVNDEDEVSGVRAPLPERKETPAAASQPTATPPAPPERLTRPVPTPPPLPPGGRRPARPAGPPTPVPRADAGKGSARPGSGPGMDLEEAQQIAQETAIATAEAALAQVAAKAREPRPKPIELPPNTEFNGEVLRQVRESRGLSLSQLAERTRISSKHLENVEADRYTALPATVYLRGILMNIARELGLDPLKVSRSYLTLAAGPKKK